MLGMNTAAKRLIDPLRSQGLVRPYLDNLA